MENKCRITVHIKIDNSSSTVSIAHMQSCRNRRTSYISRILKQRHAKLYTADETTVTQTSDENSWQRFVPIKLHSRAISTQFVRQYHTLQATLKLISRRNISTINIGYSPQTLKHHDTQKQHASVLRNVNGWINSVIFSTFNIHSSQLVFTLSIFKIIFHTSIRNYIGE